MALLGALYAYGLASSGLIGPDEPRYAAIGAEMAHSGDWITPRLWGSPWFEKPPLLYWMTALGTLAGLGPEMAPRLPVALAGWAFLVLFYIVLTREFGPTEALYATAVLGASAGWIAYSFVAVTDVPMAATLCAALLLCLRYLRGDSAGWVTPVAAGALLGLSVLAKALVPLVLFAPMLWPLRKNWRAIALIGGSCFLVAAPWYLLCTLRHGSGFLMDLFWRHHFERFVSDVLHHVRPWWFYIPVLIGGVFPWTPLMFLLRPRVLRDARLKFLAVWLALAFVFFSASQNKLPGYMLPLLPPLSVLLGVALAWARHTRIPLFCSAMLVASTPVIVKLLPEALANGLSRSRVQTDSLWWTIPFVAMAMLCLTLELKSRRTEALLVALGSIFLATVYVKAQSLPLIDEAVSVRPFYRQHANWLEGLCLAEVHRDGAYGLAYYAGRSFPLCAKEYVGPKIMGVDKRLILLD